MPEYEPAGDGAAALYFVEGRDGTRAEGRAVTYALTIAAAKGLCWWSLPEVWVSCGDCRCYFWHLLSKSTRVNI